MQRLISTLVLLLCTSFIIEAQNYVVKQTGDTLQGESLTFVDPILKEAYFKLDSIRINWSEISLVRNEHGVFANVSHIVSGKEVFAMRIRSGDLSIYEEVDMDVYGEERLPDELRTGQERRTLARGRMDYLMANNEIFVPSYKNMKEAVKTSPKAMENLQEMRKYQWIKRGLAFGGGGLIATSLFTMDGNLLLSPQLILGVIATGSSLFVNTAIDDYRWLAVESYNIEANLAQR